MHVSISRNSFINTYRNNFYYSDFHSRIEKCALCKNGFILAKRKAVRKLRGDDFVNLNSRYLFLLTTLTPRRRTFSLRSRKE